MSTPTDRDDLAALDGPLSEFLEWYCSSDDSHDKLAASICARLKEIPKQEFTSALGRIGLRGGEANYETIDDPCPGTLGWIFDSSPSGKGNLASWLTIPHEEDEERTFWITGDPGTGKSVLMKHVLKEIQRTPSLLLGDSGTSVLHPVVVGLFLTPQEDVDVYGIPLEQLLRQCPTEVTTSFVHVLTQAISKPVYDKWSGKPYIHEWIKDILKDALQTSTERIQEKGHPMYVFLDGWERHEREFPYLYFADTEFLEVWSNAKVCMASRPQEDFHNWWRPFYIKLLAEDNEDNRSRTMFLQDHTARDIRTFCERVLSDLPLATRTLRIRSIIRNCGGSFIAAQDLCCDVLKELDPSSDAPRNGRSAALLDSMLQEFRDSRRMLSDQKHDLQEISLYLNIILISKKLGLPPLSLVQLAALLICLAQREWEQDINTREPFRWIGLHHFANTVRGLAYYIEERLYPFVLIRNTAHHKIHPNFIAMPGPVLNGDDEDPERFALDLYTLRRAARMKVTILNPPMGWVLNNTEKGKQLLSLYGHGLSDRELEETICSLIGGWWPSIIENGRDIGPPLDVINLVQRCREEGEDLVHEFQEEGNPDHLAESMEGSGFWV